MAAERPLIVGIDESDKLESDDRAREFVNELKALFGQRRCYYLVSVSEDAISSFERRGMPFRDAFDSAFDEIIRVPYLPLMDAKRLLSRRVVGLPEPYVDLCHCLSGGLARDLIRSARAVLAAGALTSNRSLAEVTREVVSIELAGKADAVAGLMRLPDIEPEVTEFLRWISFLRDDRLGAIRPLASRRLFEDKEDVFKFTRDPRSGPTAEARSALGRLGRELAGFYYFACTLEDFFTDDLSVEDLKRAEQDSGAGSLNQLARARQSFSVSAQLSWDQISAFRRHWQLDTIPLPSVL